MATNRLEAHFSSGDGEEEKPSVPAAPAALSDRGQLVRGILNEYAKMAKHNRGVHKRLCDANKDFDELWDAEEGKKKIFRTILIGQAQSNHLQSLILSGLSVMLESLTDK